MADGSVFARVHVLVLCDEVERVPGAGVLYDLRGVRTGMRVSSFPFTHPQLCAYLQLSGHEGTATGRIGIVREATDEEIAFASIEEVRLWGPLAVVHYWLGIQHCEFPAAGLCWFQVLLNQKLVAERRFHVLNTAGEVHGGPT
jgi:hypothetical protein